MKTYAFLWLHLDEFFLEWEMFQTRVVEKITHILCVQEHSLDNLAIYEKMWKKKNTVEPRKPQIIIWRVRFARWIPKATNTHSEYVILIAFQRQQWLRERASVLHLYLHRPSWNLAQARGRSHVKVRDTLRDPLAGNIQVLSLNLPSHPVATIWYHLLCIRILIIAVTYKMEQLRPIKKKVV